MSETLRVVIVAEHASARFGGEAALPLHYFRVMRQRSIAVWLVTHARTREELSKLYPDDTRIIYIEDSAWHRAMWRLGCRLPDAISYFTTGFASRLSTQLAQRRVVRRLVREEGVNVVHQPMPVSPREPSVLHGLGVPVVIGPMNGGMDYPPAFRRNRGAVERALLALGRTSATLLNALIPGKRRAAALLVANQRTRDALPGGVCSNVIELVENGVDLDVWRPAEAAFGTPTQDLPVTFVFMGRLVEWKAVDLLVRAFAKARTMAPMCLSILGDGSERANLESLATQVGIPVGRPGEPGTIHFSGWLQQAECANHLARADALVLPSLLECGGAVVLEAMSLGKPVIATAWGGPLDYLDASCGILIEPASPQAISDGLAHAMVELASSTVTRLAMGLSGKARVQREFDWQLKVDRILCVYRDSIAGRRRSIPEVVAR